MKKTEDSNLKVKRKVKIRSYRPSRRTVEKMLAVMSDPKDNSSTDVANFLSTGRSGRRNAMPDIMCENALSSTAELPDKMNKLALAQDTQQSEACSSEKDEKPEPSR